MDEQRHTSISTSVTTGRPACYCIVTLATTDNPTYNATTTSATAFHSTHTSRAM